MDLETIEGQILELIDDSELSDESDTLLSSSDEDEKSSSDNFEQDEAIFLLLCKRKRHCIEDYALKIIPAYTEEEFKMHFRIPSSLYNTLCEKFEASEIFKNLENAKVLSANLQIALFLWFSGHAGCSFRDLADRFNVAIGTVSGIIRRVTYFISDLSQSAIKWPSEDDKQISSNYFKTKVGLEGVIGAIDGTKIQFVAPRHVKDYYIDRKNNITIQLQGVCNEKKKFIDIFVGYPGSVHDARVFENSDICPKLASLCGEYYLLGDSAYGCTYNLITPYRDNGMLTEKAIYFNRQLSSARVIIEHSFGILKQRFQQLYKCNLKGMKKLCHFVRACVVLHNLCDDNFADSLGNVEIANEENENYGVCVNDDSRRNYLCEKLFREKCMQN